MGSVTVPATVSNSVPNWVLLQTSTPSGVGTVTFSGLSGYAKYRIKAANLICTTGGATLQLRINGDTGTNYSSAGQTYGSGTAGTSVVVGATGFTIGQVSNTAVHAISAVEIDDALLLTPKQLTILHGYSTPVSVTLTGMYFGTNAVISSLTVLLSANNFSTGSIYLEGAN